MNINKVADLKGKTIKVDGFTVKVKEVIFAQAMWLIFEEPVKRDFNDSWQQISIWDQSDANRVSLVEDHSEAIMDSIWMNEAAIAA